MKGVGIDILRVSRIKKVYFEHGDRFLERICLPTEIKYIKRSQEKFFERLASTFCAKEAVFKTLGMKRPIIFREIEILRVPYPVVNLYGITLESSKKNGISKVFVSISHDGDLCISFAIAI